MEVDYRNKSVQKQYGEFTGPENIMFDITQRCNFKCLHCYNESEKGYCQDLCDNEMLKIADQIVEVKPLVVCLCGGEPMVRFDLILSIARRLSEAGITVNMVSNGSLMDENRIKKLYLSGISSIQISLDSYKEDVVDTFRNHKGAFKGAVNAIDCILNQGKVPLVSFIPTKINFRDIEGVAKLLYSKGVMKLRYMPLVPIGRGERNLDVLKMSTSDYMEFISIVERCKREMPDFDFDYGDPLEHIYLFRGNTKAQTIAYEIKSNGDVMLSSYLPYIYGNVRDYTLKDLWKNGLSNIWMRSDLQDVLLQINTLEDIHNQENFPYRNEDVDLLRYTNS